MLNSHTFRPAHGGEKNGRTSAPPQRMSAATVARVVVSKIKKGHRIHIHRHTPDAHQQIFIMAAPPAIACRPTEKSTSRLNKQRNNNLNLYGNKQLDGFGNAMRTEHPDARTPIWKFIIARNQKQLYDECVFIWQFFRAKAQCAWKWMCTRWCMKKCSGWIWTEWAKEGKSGGHIKKTTRNQSNIRMCIHSMNKR